MHVTESVSQYGRVLLVDEADKAPLEFRLCFCVRYIQVHICHMWDVHVSESVSQYGRVLLADEADKVPLEVGSYVTYIQMHACHM